MTIAYVIKVMELDVRLVKVKAHNSDRLNNWADKLTKAAAFTTLKLNLQYTRLSGYNLVLTCDHLLIEASSRCCIKQLHEAKHFYKNLQLSHNSDLKTLTEYRHIN